MSNLLSHDGINCLELEALLDGRYRVVEVLSTNHWGQIYLAQDTRRPSQPQCIIQHVKPIMVEPDYQDAIRHLFAREAAILEKLAAHDQIPQLLACFEDDEGFYLVQDFINGYPLSLEMQPDQLWTESQVVQFLQECLEPLAFVHNQGLRHGNIRPENLLRRMHDGKLMLVGFDSIRQLHLSLMSLHGQTGMLAEPVNQDYQPIEQIKGLPCLASDVYAIGMIAIQALTGVQPSQFQLNQTTGEINWQSHYKCSETSSDRELMSILNQIVRYDFNKRYASATEALQAVEQLSKTMPLKSATDESSLTVSVDPGSILFPVAETPPLLETTQAKKFSAVENSGMTLLVGLGIGAVVTGTTCGYIFLMNPPGPNDQGQQILESAKKRYEEGKLPQAISLAESIPTTSQAYSSAQVAITDWQEDWRDANSVYKKMSAALKEDNWREVLRQAKELPQTAFWKERTASVVEEAIRKAEAEADPILKKAYSQAIAKDFAGAIAQLNEIPDVSSVYPTAQEKIREYSKKLQIRGVYLLQKAYNRAVLHDFEGALAYLKQIHPDTRIYAKVQEKIQEYTKKQKIQLAAWVETADKQAIANDYQAALASLENIPSGTSLDIIVEAKEAEYTEKLYTWSNHWLQEADEQASKRNYSAALGTLQKIPLGTSAYTQAREKKQEYVRLQQLQKVGLDLNTMPVSYVPKQQSSVDRLGASPAQPRLAQQTFSSSQNLNPGSYLREATLQ